MLHMVLQQLHRKIKTAILSPRRSREVQQQLNTKEPARPVHSNSNSHLGRRIASHSIATKLKWPL